MRRKKYDDLTILPHVIAQTVFLREYRGEEWSPALRSPAQVEKIETLRLKATREQMDEFCKFADLKCKKAYEGGADWFSRLLKHRDGGRDQLYVWITHWLTAYLTGPDKIRQQMKRLEA